MPKVKMRTPTRLLISAMSFGVLVIACTYLYSAVGASLGSIGSNKALLALFGPVLALFTHMSIFLFSPLSLPLVALLAIGTVYEKTRVATALGFLSSWLAMGWYLRGLF